jgi:hypothetical protein
MTLVKTMVTGVTLVLTNYKRVHAYPLWTVLRTTVCSYPINVFQLSFNFLCLLLLYSIYLNGMDTATGVYGISAERA